MRLSLKIDNGDTSEKIVYNVYELTILPKKNNINVMYFVMTVFTGIRFIPNLSSYVALAEFDEGLWKVVIGKLVGD